MSFYNDVIFPTGLSSGSAGGPRWAVEVSVNDAGYEERNNPWAYPLHDYDVAYGVKDIADLEELHSIFMIAQGMTHGFRFRDPLDWKSCARDSDPAFDDVVILGSAVGGETSLQVYKTYAYAGVETQRKITRIFGTMLLGINGSEKTAGTHFTINKQTGVIDLTGGSTPHGALSESDEVTAGFQFHVPVRFNSNSISIQLEEYTHGTASVPLTEVRE